MMQKHKENLFLEKFSLLNSQEHTEDIKWSSSSSSEYENTSCCEKFSNIEKPRNRKRKRKTKLHKNLSNLDITIIDGSKESNKDKSPILVAKCMDTPVSPILAPKCLANKSNSPILPHKTVHQKSPILILKSTSPKYLIKVKKKLSYDQNKKDILCSNLKKGSICYDSESQVEKNEELLYLKKEIISNDGGIETTDKTSESNSRKLSEYKENLQNEKFNLIKKVKNYFDGNFSSENTSQNISNTPTPEECVKHEEIDILSCKTQMISSLQQTIHESTSNSDTSTYFEKSNKKLKHKKGGLAYRLNVLLKKQNAHVSLWQHERFLAGNSNFVIPKGEHVVFCIKKVHFNYGCYMLDVVDIENENFTIFINSFYVNINISVESVFKLYEPYKILELENNNKIIINVCKFECFSLKQ